MTVKCVTKEDKIDMANLYVAKISTASIAQLYDVSERTVNRVLVEEGVSHMRHRTPKDEVQLLKKEEAQQQLPKPNLYESAKVLIKLIFSIKPKQQDNAIRY